MILTKQRMVRSEKKDVSNVSLVIFTSIFSNFFWTRKIREPGFRPDSIILVNSKFISAGFLKIDQQRASLKHPKQSRISEIHTRSRYICSEKCCLTLSWQRPLAYRNQSIDLRSTNSLKGLIIDRSMICNTTSQCFTVALTWFSARKSCPVRVGIGIYVTSNFLQN